MKNLVINFTKCSAGSTIASNRIAKYIALQTGFLLVDTLEKANEAIKKEGAFGSVYVVNGMFGFCEFRKQCVEICEAAGQLIWVGNDYQIKKPTQLKHLNFLDACQYGKQGDNTFLIDWNKLTHKTGIAEKEPIVQGLFYYGAFRQNREAAFDRYFLSSAYEKTISTTSKNETKFVSRYPSVRVVKPLDNVIESAGNFAATIYIEDESREDGIRLTPANRFYECAAAKVFQLFDSNCVDSFNGIDISDYIVKSADDVLIKINDQQLKKKQFEQFEQFDFKKDLDYEFQKFHLTTCENKQHTQIDKTQTSLF
jgi:hypothetical protein